MRRLQRVCWIAAAGLLPVAVSMAVADDGKSPPSAPGIPATIADPPPLPKEFAFTFSLPYGLGDEFPREPAEFDRMLGLLKGAGFNTVHCPYTDWRVPLFRKHGTKMMVDVLAWKPPVEADVRRDAQRGKVEQMCRGVRGDNAIWGYNLWNERLDWAGKPANLDLWLRMLRTWDPTHPVWVGTYRYLHCESYPTNPGVVGWYDYHWARGFDWNFAMLDYYRKIAPKRQSVMGKWLLRMDYNRNLYTLNTSIAHGLKVAIWFIGGPYDGREKDLAKRWHEDHHLVRIGRHMQSLYPLIGRLGMPTAVYSTPTRRTADDKAKEPGLPKHTHAFPEDHWLQVRQGEVLCGFFHLEGADEDDPADVVYVCNHNAMAPQEVVLGIRQKSDDPRKVWQWNRERGDWIARGVVDEVRFTLAAADAEVFRVGLPGPSDLPATAKAPTLKAWPITSAGSSTSRSPRARAPAIPRRPSTPTATAPRPDS